MHKVSALGFPESAQLIYNLFLLLHQGNLQPISFDALKSDASGLYKIWPLFVTRSRNYKDSIDITIITQSSVSNLPDVERLVKHWDGPVSVGEC